MGGGWRSDVTTTFQKMPWRTGSGSWWRKLRGRTDQRVAATRRGFLQEQQTPKALSPKESKAGSQRDIGASTSIAMLFTVTRTWKQPRCLSLNECVNKVWSIHAMECHSALKKKEILTLATR